MEENLFHCLVQMLFCEEDAKGSLIFRISEEKHFLLGEFWGLGKAEFSMEKWKPANFGFYGRYTNVHLTFYCLFSHSLRFSAGLLD